MTVIIAVGPSRRIVTAALIALALAANALAKEEPRSVSLQSSRPWPTVFELKRGESVNLTSGIRSTVVKLVGVRHHYEPDYWTGKSEGHATYADAELAIEVNGQPHVIRCRPYQMPVTLSGVRLYVEATRAWANTEQLAPLEGVTGDARFSAVPAGKPWGPETLVFPLADYRWRSATYQNTWSSLVPFNIALYYHRGEDLGAIPDRLDVLAALGGRISQSPLPRGDGSGNAVALDMGHGAVLRYVHMNLEMINPRAVDDTTFSRGEALGKTGCTWNGRRSQHYDPHIHLALELDGRDVSFYPAMMEAYFRSYDDSLIAVAGGYGFATVGGSYQLDGSRSLARPGRSIVSYRWRLHDGRQTEGPQVAVQYDRAGYYAEELIVRADDGSLDRDYIHVRVYDSVESRKIINGWAYYAPSRDIRPRTPVCFWNRLKNSNGPAKIDFGDGSPAATIGDEARHAYAVAGLYTVTLTARGQSGEPAILKLRVRVVEPGR